MQKPNAVSGTLPVVLKGSAVFCVFFESAARLVSENGVPPAPLPMAVPWLMVTAVGTTLLPSVVTSACAPAPLLEEPEELEEDELLEAAPLDEELLDDELPDEELEDELEEELLLEEAPTPLEDDEEVAPPEEDELDEVVPEDEPPEEELLDEEPLEDELLPEELSLLQAESAVSDSAAVSTTRGLLVSMVSFTGSIPTGSFSSRPNHRRGAAALPRIRNRGELFGGNVAN